MEWYEYSKIFWEYQLFYSSRIAIVCDAPEETDCHFENVPICVGAERERIEPSPR
jgi:hypothetical protein